MLSVFALRQGFTLAWSSLSKRSKLASDLLCWSIRTDHILELGSSEHLPPHLQYLSVNDPIITKGQCNMFLQSCVLRVHAPYPHKACPPQLGLPLSPSCSESVRLCGVCGFPWPPSVKYSFTTNPLIACLAQIGSAYVCAPLQGLSHTRLYLSAPPANSSPPVHLSIYPLSNTTHWSRDPSLFSHP